MYWQARKLTEKENFKVVIMPGQTKLNPKMSRRKRTNSIDSEMCDNEVSVMLSFIALIIICYNVFVFCYL